MEFVKHPYLGPFLFILTSDGEILTEVAFTQILPEGKKSQVVRIKPWKPN